VFGPRTRKSAVNKKVHPAYFAATALLVLGLFLSSNVASAQERCVIAHFNEAPSVEFQKRPELVDPSADHPETKLPWLNKPSFDVRTLPKLRLDFDPDLNAAASRPIFDTADNRGIEWGGLLVDSTKFLLFQHAFRLATEVDTRRGLRGPFLQNYVNSVTNIHGWNDGDPFFVNYIDHPMEGGVAGFIEVGHDPRYRRVQFGRSSRYWKSRLRAMAFSAAFSLQFEIGPVSEASIGGIQRVPYKTGVVDWVITPTVGFGWMIGEDALDKFVIQRFELRTQNHAKRLLLRSLLNPTRSFANMMQGKVPWHRETRPGVWEF
jgi:hypothetical protein